MATSAAHIDYDEGAAPAAPAASKVRVYAKTDGLLYSKDDAGTETLVSGGAGGGGGGSGQGLVDFAQSTRSSGDVSVNSATYVNVDTGMDLVLDASTGDVIESRVECNTNGPATYCVLDVVTVVGGSAVNSFTSGTTPNTTSSHPGWARGNLSNDPGMAGAKQYALQAGDISGGTVTLRLRARTGGSVSLSASGDPYLYFSAKNLGPAI